MNQSGATKGYAAQTSFFETSFFETSFFETSFFDLSFAWISFPEMSLYKMSFNEMSFYEMSFDKDIFSQGVFLIPAASSRCRLFLHSMLREAAKSNCNADLDRFVEQMLVLLQLGGCLGFLTAMWFIISFLVKLNLGL